MRERDMLPLGVMHCGHYFYYMITRNPSITFRVFFYQNMRLVVRPRTVRG